MPGNTEGSRPRRISRGIPSRSDDSGFGRLFAALQTAAPLAGVQMSAINMRDVGELERNIVSFARVSNSGLLVPGSPALIAHRDLIITLAARHKLPAVYFERYFVTRGGLISYGPRLID